MPLALNRMGELLSYGDFTAHADANVLIIWYAI